jgi:pimeloyl-ACP methyl ester carboxylesterase
MLLQSSHLTHNLALLALRSCAGAYMTPEDDVEGLFLPGTRVSHLERDNIEAAVYDRPDGMLVVAFRGTDEAQDVCRDLRFSFRRSPVGGEVHGGFLLAWEAVRGEVMERISHAHEREKKRVLVTGHSLGGAIATLAHAQARTRGILTDCYTFGAPRVGDRDFVARYRRAGLNELHYRMVMEGDPVPALPPAWLGFRHVGTEVYASSEGHLEQPPGATLRFFRTLVRMGQQRRDHALSAYERTLAPMVAGQAQEAA